MDKVFFNCVVPIVMGTCLPLAGGALKEDAPQEISFRSSERRMKAMLAETPKLEIVSLSADDFLLRKYESVAISTDLEPDDVLALAILFEEANRIYRETPGKKYPIDLVVVGEGNSAIKKMRMERLLKEYFHLPEGVVIPVVAGHSTKGNDFSYDGEELFGAGAFTEYPFPKEGGEKASHALREWAARAEKPLIVQLQPAQELLALSLDPAIARKTTVFFYGSFNLRETARDPETVRILKTGKRPYFEQLNALMDHFAASFEKMAIVESYGVLGEEGSVYHRFPWTQKIREKIVLSKNDFIQMFSKLSSNWNRYLFEKKLDEVRDTIGRLIEATPLERRASWEEIQKNFSSVIERWDGELFNLSVEKANFLLVGAPVSMSEEEKLQRSLLAQKLKLAHRIQPNLEPQFTLADVCVALALTDSSQFFKATPADCQYTEQGFLHPLPASYSNVVYYDRVDREELAARLEQFLETLHRS